MAEQLAIVRSPGYGMRDMHQPGLWFDTYVTDTSAALQVFTQPQANKVIEDFGVREVQDLAGKPCWVEVGGGTIQFLRAAKAGAR